MNYTNQLNQTLMEGLANPGTSSFQSLFFEIAQQNVKRLTNIAVSGYPPGGVPWTGAQGILQRVIVCDGTIARDALFNVQNDPLPGVQLYPTGAGRIYFDVMFRNSLVHNFSEPLEFEPEQILNVIVGRAWLANDVNIGVTSITTALSVNGYFAEDKAAKRGFFR